MSIGKTIRVHILPLERVRAGKRVIRPFPASTFLVISGLARPELLLEIEATDFVS